MGTTWGQLGRRIINNAQMKKIPVAGQFELTTRCNLQCKMCYICQPANEKNAIGRERTAAEWIRLAEEARDAGMLYLLLTGGEIFLRKDFKIIYEELSRMGFNIELYTNATLITPETADWLAKIPPSRIGITLYGASPETYGKVCGNPNAFDYAVRGIDLLLERNLRVWLKTTVIRENAVDFTRMADFADARGMKLGIVNYISPRREGINTCPQEHRLSPKELLNYELFASKYLYGRKKGSDNIEPEDDCADEIESLKDTLPDNKNDTFKCPSAKSAFWITWDGRMTPCSLMNDHETYPFENGFKAAWEEIQKLCSTVPSCQECNKCSLRDYCMTCPARLKAETGSYERPAQYLCELAQLKKIYERMLINEGKLKFKKI